MDISSGGFSEVDGGTAMLYGHQYDVDNFSHAFVNPRMSSLAGARLPGMTGTSLVRRQGD